MTDPLSIVTTPGRDGDLFVSAIAMAERIRSGTVTSRDLLERHLDRIARLNPALGAVVTLDADGARRTAGQRDAELADGRIRGPLHGVPMTVKDAFATAGLRTTSGMADRADHVPEADAVAVARLRAAGAVIMGKTNVPEGITGQETANALFGRTVNPWNPARTPGGSSGGAAAAVAAGLSALEVGSDSGGSIRQPAHCCGVYGHIPTQGLVPLRGHLPLVGLDEIGMQVDLMGAGPIARHAGDLEVALSVLAGPDEEDGRAWNLQLPAPRFDNLSEVRLALWADDADFPVSAAVRDALLAAGEQLAAAGATVLWDQRPAFRLADAERVAFALWVASTTMSTDAITSLEDQAADLAPGDDSLAARRLRSETMLHHDWALLDAERRRVARAWASIFDHVDLLICPVSPVVAGTHDPDPAQVADLDRRLHRLIDVDGRSRPYLDQMTWNIVVGMAGLPSTVVPLGPDSAGLPVGAQVVGPRFADRTTIRFAAALADAGVGGYRRPPEGTGGP